MATDRLAPLLHRLAHLLRLVPVQWFALRDNAGMFVCSVGYCLECKRPIRVRLVRRSPRRPGRYAFDGVGIRGSARRRRVGPDPALTLDALREHYPRTKRPPHTTLAFTLKLRRFLPWSERR